MYRKVHKEHPRNSMACVGGRINNPRSVRNTSTLTPRLILSAFSHLEMPVFSAHDFPAGTLAGKKTNDTKTSQQPGIARE